MFNDADLIGIPFRIVVSPKTLADGEVEFKLRAEKDAVRVKLEEITALTVEKVQAELAKYL